jgi:hypothetical protein
MSAPMEIVMDLRVDSFAEAVEENGWEWSVRGDQSGEAATLTVSLPIKVAGRFAVAAMNWEPAE